MFAMKERVWFSSGGSLRYERIREVRAAASSVDTAVESWVKIKLMMMPRVVNSLGPFFSLSKSIPSRAGKSSASMSVRRCSATDVVQRALRHSNVSWRRLSSCSSLLMY